MPHDKGESIVTDRNLEYHRLVVSGVPKKEAALRAGYAPMSVPRLRRGIIEAMEEAGVTDKRIAQKLAEGLEAKTRWGSTDHNAITKYLGIVGKWRGFERPPQINLNIGLNSYNLPENPEKVAHAMDMIDTIILERETPILPNGETQVQP